jgi:WhiB family redox-sensing transcriptional regulator
MVVIQLPAQRAAQQAERRDWWRSAACRDADPELFFPVTQYGPGAGETERAKAVCEACPVRRECLLYALTTGQAHGVWGGLTESERQPLLARDRELTQVAFREPRRSGGRAGGSRARSAGR